jgi:HSP20 family protein
MTAEKCAALAKRTFRSKKGGAMTTLVKWTPFRELDLFDRRFKRAFGDFGFAPTFAPAADIYETPEEFVVELEVPGYEEKELGIMVSDHVLTVRGERKEATEQEEKAFLLHERLEKFFERRFNLPPEADTAKLTATFRQGVVEIHAPKALESKPRKIPIGGMK